MNQSSLSSGTTPFARTFREARGEPCEANRKREKEKRGMRGPKLRSRELSEISTTVDLLVLEVSWRLLVIEKENKENSRL